jgi:carboxylesterase type B
MPLLQALSVFFLLFSFFAFASAIQLYSSITPVVTNSSNGVSFHGNYSNGVESFFNIRFGYDTSGPNRFAHSKAFEYPAGTMVNATAFGAACPQQKHALPVNFLSNVTNQSEDCLNLRIDRPANTTADAKLPVMVYIYGGGDNTGQIYDSLYSPAGLLLGAAAKKIPIIYVAMKYDLPYAYWRKESAD